MTNEKLRAARLQKRWSQVNAAEKIGVSVLTYSRWEKGTQIPYLASLDQLCAAFDLPPEDLGFEQVTGSVTPQLALVASSPMLVAEAPAILVESSASMVANDPFAIAIVALILAQRMHGWSLDDLHARIHQEMRNYDMSRSDLTRRDAIELLIKLPLAVLGTSALHATSFDTISATEALPLLTAGIAACWKLYYSGGNVQEIQQTITVYIAQLEAMKLSNAQQTAASRLTSQSYQLAAMVSLENEDYTAALTQANHAMDYAQGTKDPDLLAAAILRKATVLYYQRRHRQMTLVLQQAVPYIKQVSPLMRSRIYSELATSTDLKDVVRYGKQAIDSCPDDVQDDPSFAYTHTTPYILYLNQEIGYSNLGMHKEAWEALELAEKFVPDIASTRRLELLTHQATAALGIGDLDLMGIKMQQAIQASKVINTELWLSNVESIHQRMKEKWGNDRQVKDIGEMLME